MLKLNAGFSRKVGEPNYGSRGASVNVELEVESGLIGDPEGLLARIRNLFDLARQSVDQELAQQTSEIQRDNARRDNGNNGRRDVRRATASQLRAIRAICERQGVDPLSCVTRYGVTELEDLTLRQASRLIDELKSAPSETQR